MPRPALRSLLILLLTLCLWGGTARASSFGGVGLQVVPVAGGELVVLRVLPDSPAAEAGLREGDLVFEVDDFPLEGSDFATVIRERLWGEPGSAVRLRYLRPGVAGVGEATLRRVPMDPEAPAPPGVRMVKPDAVE